MKVLSRYPSATKQKDIARNRMTAELIAQAQRLSQELVAKTPTRWQGKTASPPSKPTRPPANSGLVRDVQLALTRSGRIRHWGTDRLRPNPSSQLPIH